MENELPESFKICIPYNYEGVICGKLVGFYNEKRVKSVGKTFLYVFSLKYLSLCDMDIGDFNIDDDICSFVDYDLPEITITQLMNAKPKVNETDEGFERLSRILKKTIEALQDIRANINEKS